MEKIKNFLFVNSGHLQIITKNTFWLTVGEFTARMLKFILFIYAIRMLGIKEWGLFSYSLALIGIIGVFSDFGINTTIIKTSARDQNNLNKYLKTGFLLKIILAFISSGIIAFIFFFNQRIILTKELIILSAILLFLETIIEYLYQTYRAQEKMEVESAFRIITTVILVLIGFLLIDQLAIASSLLVAYILAYLVGIFFIISNIKKKLINAHMSAEIALCKPLIKEAWPIGIVIIISTIMGSIDTIMLGWFRSVEDIGLYSTAQKLAQTIYLVPLLLSNSMLPTLSKITQEKKADANTLVNKMISRTFFYTIPVVILCIFLGEMLLGILFGPQYENSFPAFIVMVLAVISIAPGSIILNAMFAENKQRVLVPIFGIGLLISILLNFILIPEFGIIGAAISLLLGHTTGNTLLLIYYYKYSNKLPR